jgi:hypothetical protein
LELHRKEWRKLFAHIEELGQWITAITFDQASRAISQEIGTGQLFKDWVHALIFDGVQNSLK